MLNIYLLTRNDYWFTNADYGNHPYDTYDSVVVIAENEESAKLIRPRDRRFYRDFEWPGPENVDVQHIGFANSTAKSRVVLASYNAG